MKPVETSDIDLLVERGSILILDQDSLAIHFVGETIRRSPNCISTKTSNKCLPTEIWMEILAWAELDADCHSCDPVYPVRVEQNGTESALCCRFLKGWNPCGEIENGWSMWIYEKYLQGPLQQLEDARPFELPDANAAVVMIPINMLTPDQKFLFHEIEVPDMISRVEKGACGLCWNGRWHCPGCGGGREIMQDFTSIEHSPGCGYHMFCPLCIGVYYAQESLCQEVEDWAEDELMSDEEYGAWQMKRLAELGY
ncbi:hypothetical protein FALBO_10493 [Fusarium albosuccineum]|uniref:Uncharacterized protein n=1 Tax=Fusarium albosuccineum TaxID=1237068 RepID=A0A8H4P511_9HYPO|nr:hypothetical protein FALBO_10493 [Fusarium albosuccineum]